jgi:hypothetical protein
MTAINVPDLPEGYRIGRKRTVGKAKHPLPLEHQYWWCGHRAGGKRMSLEQAIQAVHDHAAGKPALRRGDWPRD